MGLVANLAMATGRSICYSLLQHAHFFLIRWWEPNGLATPSPDQIVPDSVRILLCLQKETESGVVWLNLASFLQFSFQFFGPGNQIEPAIFCLALSGMILSGCLGLGVARVSWLWKIENVKIYDFFTRWASRTNPHVAALDLQSLGTRENKPRSPSDSMTKTETGSSQNQKWRNFPKPSPKTRLTR